VVGCPDRFCWLTLSRTTTRFDPTLQRCFHRTLTEELAERAGARQETVSRIETGKNAPNVATVDKLDRVLKEADV
jgi:transcriptional regulator with XRE-family HTH domain